MLDVGEHQLLMLLFVVQAECQEMVEPGAGRAIQQPVHLRIDVLAIGADLCHCRPGQEPALATQVHLADRVVIGIEEIVETFVELTIAGQVRDQQEILEEPAGMCQMPLGRADIGHRLRHEILGLQRLAEVQRLLPHAPVAVLQIGVGPAIRGLLGR